VEKGREPHTGLDDLMLGSATREFFVGRSRSRRGPMLREHRRVKLDVDCRWSRGDESREGHSMHYGGNVRCRC